MACAYTTHVENVSCHGLQHWLYLRVRFIRVGTNHQCRFAVISNMHVSLRDWRIDEMQRMLGQFLT